jgi:topoisomerase-4 subunit A
MIKLQEELNEVNDNLANLVVIQIDYYKMLLKKYGKGRERKTEIRILIPLQRLLIARRSQQKLYVDREEALLITVLKRRICNGLL